MHLLFFNGELNHAAAGRELLQFANGQNRCSLQIFQYLREKFSFRRTDIDEMTAVSIVIPL